MSGHRGITSIDKTDTFITTGAAAAQTVTGNPMSQCALQVTKTGNVTSWIVLLKGSIDGVNWSTILTHDSSVEPSGETIWPANERFLCNYFRTECTALTLGAGTNVKARWLASN